MFSRVAIVNRGEAAMRLIHAVRDLSAETGTRVETVAFYTDADRSATFVREADLAYPLGPASARPYLDPAVLEQQVKRMLADPRADALVANLRPQLSRCPGGHAVAMVYENDLVGEGEDEVERVEIHAGAEYYQSVRGGCVEDSLATFR